MKKILCTVVVISVLMLSSGCEGVVDYFFPPTSSPTKRTSSRPKVTKSKLKRKVDVKTIYKELELKRNITDVKKKIGKPVKIEKALYESMGDTWVYKVGKQEVRAEVRDGKVFKVEHIDKSVNPPEVINSKSDEKIITQ